MHSNSYLDLNTNRSFEGTFSMKTQKLIQAQVEENSLRVQESIVVSIVFDTHKLQVSDFVSLVVFCNTELLLY